MPGRPHTCLVAGAGQTNMAISPFPIKYQLSAITSTPTSTLAWEQQACSGSFPGYKPEHMIESSQNETKSVFPIKNEFLGCGW